MMLEAIQDVKTVTIHPPVEKQLFDGLTLLLEIWLLIFFNLKSSSEIHFFSHRISTWGIEPDKGKADCIKNWPIPKSASDVWSFLGLVCYLAAFLPKLAKYTIIQKWVAMVTNDVWLMLLSVEPVMKVAAISLSAVL
jgi:hypothetical protein